MAPPQSPTHFTPPTPRELRAQAVQRLQVGLGGLVAMLLLVGLASVIMQHGRKAEAPASAQVASSAENADPLADIGVVPSPEAGGHRPSSAPSR